MVQKPQYISHDLLIHPGETILEVIEERKITQKELAVRTGFTEKHISTVINGKKSISARLALALEIALNIPSSFWKNLQNNYDLELEIFNQFNEISNEEIKIAKTLVTPIETITNLSFENFNDSLSVLEFRKLLNINNLLAIKKLNHTYYRKQFKANTSDYVMYTWQYLLEKQSESQTDNPLNIDLLISKLEEIKSIMLLDASTHIPKLTKIFNECGISFVVNKHVNKAPINGLTTLTKKNKVMIAMTIRDKYVDVFWFSLFHEIAHVIFEDFKNIKKDAHQVKKIEDRAYNFARDSLINPEKYNQFINNNDYTDKAILIFANENNILPGIILGRLMNDQKIPWSRNRLRSQYEWIEK